MGEREAAVIPATAGEGATNSPVNQAAIDEWYRANQELFSTLYLLTPGSVRSMLIKFEGKENTLSDGHGAWEVMLAKHEDNSKQRHSQLNRATPDKDGEGSDPDTTSSNWNLLRDSGTPEGRVRGRGETVTSERFEDILPRGLTSEYDWVKFQ